MSKNDRTLSRIPLLLFPLYASLFAFRDISLELIVNEDPIVFSLLLAATISILGFGHLLRKGETTAFLRRVSQSKTLTQAIALGAINGLVYAVGFSALKVIGAGVFNLIEFGLTPVLLAAIGVVVFKETPRWTLWGALALYVLGIWCLFGGSDIRAWQWLLVAFLSPIGTAASDGLSKSLLAAGFSRHELLVIRFAPAIPVLILLGSSLPAGITLNSPWLSLWVAIGFGYVPLSILLYLIERAPLSRLAAWDFMIPGVAFFGTLHAHPENQEGRALIGAILIMACVVVGDLSTFTGLFRKKPTG